MQGRAGLKEMRYIEELKSAAGVDALDCVIDDTFDRIFYLVRKEDMGAAIGKDGANIRRMMKTLGRRVEVIEVSDDACEFVKNILRPARVDLVVYDGISKKYNAYVASKGDFALGVGRNGSAVSKARLLLQQYFGQEFGDVILREENV